jgi:hypothetical protein
MNSNPSVVLSPPRKTRLVCGDTSIHVMAIHLMAVGTLGNLIRAREGLSSDRMEMEWGTFSCGIRNLIEPGLRTWETTQHRCANMAFPGADGSQDFCFTCPGEPDGETFWDCQQMHLERRRSEQGSLIKGAVMRVFHGVESRWAIEKGKRRREAEKEPNLGV